ncbi:MAG TPA: hypothetical protein PLJ00_15765 [Chitinophagales bacterium]|nr:hypothetical protein [Chitinophagales bacterium]
MTTEISETMQRNGFYLTEDMFDKSITHVFEKGSEVGTIQYLNEDGGWYEAKGKHFKKGVQMRSFGNAVECFLPKGVIYNEAHHGISQIQLQFKD